MAKTITSEKIIENIAKAEVISEREILLLKGRMNRGKEVDLSPLDDIEVFVTDEQAEKGLAYLRKHFLTTKNKKRKNCKWGDYELQAIGYQGDGVPLEKLNPHHLFTFQGYMNIGRCVPFYSPIYEINGISYYMECGEPKIY